jgi:hypothetical protein
MRRGLLCALVLQGFLWLGAAPAAAAGTPTLQVEVIGQGTVTGNGINCGLGSLSCYAAYGSGTPSVALTASPDTAAGWTFEGWEDGATCGLTSPCTVLLSGSKTATAVFTKAGAVPSNTLNVSSSSNGAITNGSTNYPIACDAGVTPALTACSLTTLQGSTLTVTEQPHGGYFFNGWTGACSGTGVSCSVYLTGDAFAGASFAASTTRTLTVTVTGSGSVSGGGISCGAGSSCSAPEAPNSTVTLTATPYTGYALTGWSGGGCSGLQLTCTVQMSSDLTVTATFAPQVRLAVTVTGNGYVTGGGIGCDGGQTCTAQETPGTTVILTATPNASGSSVFWSGCTSTAGTQCSLTIGTTPIAVTVTFSGGTPPPVSTNSLTVTVKGDGTVVATAGAASIYCTAAGGSGCSATVTAGTSLVLNALPASGSSGDFTGWAGDCSAFTTTTCTLTMSSSKTVEADFAGANTTYLLTGQVVGSGSISGAGLHCSSTGSTGCSVAQAASATVTVTATPSFGSTFTGWSGACTGTGSCTLTMTTPRTVTATFAANSGGGSTQNLTVGVTGAGSVTGPKGVCTSTAGKTNSCPQAYTQGQAVTLTAKPSAGYAFVGWSGSCSGKKSTCAVTMTTAQTVGATFGIVHLASTRPPAVVKTAGGYRVTVYFSTRDAGTAKLTVKRGTTTVGAKRATVTPGHRRMSYTVSRKGRYLFTLTLRGHSIRWGVSVR